MTERAEPVALARRDGSSGGADPGTPSARAAEPSVRRFDGPRLALAAIRIGPAAP